MQDILNHFKKNDPVMYQAVKKYGLEVLDEMAHPDTYFLKLVRNIAYQQLAGKAADAIFSRFEKLFPQGEITPKNIISVAHEKMREVGLSNAKARYIRNIAEAVESKMLRLHDLPNMTDEEVVEHLSQVKGIGRWTAEMFLMFTLNRPDVFSFGDLGLKNGMKKLYGFKREPSKKRIESIVKKWAPYRTYAAMVLWKALDNR